MHNYINQLYIQSKFFIINKIITSIFEIMTRTHLICQPNFQECLSNRNFWRKQKIKIFLFCNNVFNNLMYTLNKGNLIHRKMQLGVANTGKPPTLLLLAQKTHLSSGNTKYKVPCYCCWCISACPALVAIPLHFTMTFRLFNNTDFHSF